MNLNGQIDWNDTDRIVSNDTRYVSLNGDWWRESSSWQTRQNGSSALTRVGLTRTRLTGLASSRGGDIPVAAGVLTSETHSLDALNNETVSCSYLDRSSHTTTQTTTTPASSLAAVATVQSGLTVSSRSPTGVTTAYAYDALGRQVSQTDGRGNTSQIVYDAQGRVAKTIDALGNETTYTYDALGRQTAVTDPLGHTITTAYDAEGRVLAQRGATYPVDYAYDAYGNKVSMTTYRNEDLANDDTTIRMAYDRMGRRVVKNDETFVYDNYLNIGKTIWDPTEQILTRNLMLLKKQVEWCFQDANKNVSVVLQDYSRVCIQYSPFGEKYQTKTSADHKFYFSNELYDGDLCLYHYNFRSYQPANGRWNSYDPYDQPFLYMFLKNDPINCIDELGLDGVSVYAPSWLYDLGNEAEDVVIRDPNFGVNMRLSAETLGWTWARIDVVVDCVCDHNKVAWVIDYATVSIWPIVHLRSRYNVSGKDVAARKFESDHVSDIVSWGNGDALTQYDGAMEDAKKRFYPDRISCVGDNYFAFRSAMMSGYNSAMDSSRVRWDDSGLHSWKGN